MLSLEEGIPLVPPLPLQKGTLTSIKPCSDVFEWEDGEKDDSRPCPFLDATFFSPTRLSFK